MNDKLINLSPYNRSERNNWIKRYNENNVYDINSKHNFYIPYKDIFNSKVFKNNNQIIICYSKLKSLIFSELQTTTYKWLSRCYRSYPQVLEYLKNNYGLQIFYMKNFVNDYFIIDNGFIGVAKYYTSRNSQDYINTIPLMCLCLKSNNLVEFASNKEAGIIDKKHFALLIDHSFVNDYPTIFKKIYKEYIINFVNQKYDILYTNIESKIYNADKWLKNDFKNTDELFSYLNSLNDELKHI